MFDSLVADDDEASTCVVSDIAVRAPHVTTTDATHFRIPLFTCTHCLKKCVGQLGRLLLFLAARGLNVHFASAEMSLGHYANLLHPQARHLACGIIAPQRVANAQFMAHPIIQELNHLFAIGR